jgi:YaaC-like Protein
MFIHTYVHKLFGSIPSLHLTEPFAKGARYSQLCVTYMVAYVLGMLVRYYPTHWMSLIQGDKGDTMWPTINRAQQFVEASYPELVTEMITDILKEAETNPAPQPETKKA